MFTLSLLRAFSKRYFIQQLSISYSCAVFLTIRRCAIENVIRNNYTPYSPIPIAPCQYQNVNPSSLLIPSFQRFTSTIKDKERNSKLNIADELFETTSTSSINDDLISSSPSDTKESHPWLDRFFQQNKRRQRLVSGIVAVNGFINSCFRSIISKKNQQHHTNTLRQNVQLIKEYLQSTQIDQEIIITLYNRRLYSNIRLLSMIENVILQQQYGITTNDRRDLAVAISNNRTLENVDMKQSIPTMHDALRFMKHATAVYGDAMIRSSEINLGRSKRTSSTTTSSSSSIANNYYNTFIRTFFNTDTKEQEHYSVQYMKNRISHHCEIPVSDIIHMDIDYDGDVNHSRHMIVIDHKHQSIVLSIRGTFTISEVVTDLTAYTRKDFCNGEAHTAFAYTAERTWDVVKPIVLNLLQQYSNYELVITGHSLGGAVASLMHIMLHSNPNLLLPDTKGSTNIRQQNCDENIQMPYKVRCFVYGSVPCFTPIENIPKNALTNCISYIYDQDCVPFVSLYSIRQLLYRLRVIDEQNQLLSWNDRRRILNGKQPLPLSMIDTIRMTYIHNNTINPFEMKDGAPLLIIPALNNIWIKENKEINTTSSSSSSSIIMKYNYKICDSMTLSTMGLSIYMNDKNGRNTMFSDHLCGQYEEAIQHLL